MSEQASVAIKELFRTSQPACLGPHKRDGTLAIAVLNARLDDWLPQMSVSPVNQQLIRALTLLWHDHLDAAHNIAQDIENPDGSFVHAIMHRREPDYWNSKYWFRRVGKRPVFPRIAERVDAFLKQNGAGELAVKLLPNGNWDSLAFVDACEQAARSQSSKQEEMLQEIQRIEFEVLIERFTGVG